MTDSAEIDLERSYIAQQAATLARHRAWCDQAQAEYETADDAWCEADCPTEGPLAYEHSKAEIWLRHCERQSLQAARSLSQLEARLVRLEGHGLDIE